VAALALAALVLAFDGRLLGRPFASEDFLLLRALLADPPWQGLREWWLGPWLGIEVVRFWRPVSTALLAVEAQLFGASPAGYELVHHLVHAGNATLVYALLARLAPAGRRLTAGLHAAPLAGAVLFALHPLHPNAVAWVASFATLFGIAFLLGALVAFQAWREGGRRRSLALCLALFALALASYEAAVVFPLLAAAWEHLTPRPVGDRRRGPAAYLACLALAALYLLLRAWLFGGVLGGYAATAERLAGGGVTGLAADLPLALHRLVHPAFGSPTAAPALWALAAVLLPVPLVARHGLLRRWLLGWLWAAAALAPFAFTPFVPANGRYAYLAAAGLAVAASGLAALPGRVPAVAGTAAVVALAVHWGVLLVPVVTAHQRAGALAARVADGLAALPGDAPAFVSGHPLFVETAGGVPLAQVLRYGLADSVAPPFRASRRAVYPLPRGLAAASRGALARDLPAAAFPRWDGGRFVPTAPPPAPAPRLRAEVVGSGGGVPEAVVVRPGSGPAPARYRLRLLTRGNPAEVTAASGDGPTRLAFPAAHARSMARLYPGPQHWWVEGLDAAGRVVATSAVRE
jgi:hypothetical protein